MSTWKTSQDTSHHGCGLPTAICGGDRPHEGDSMTVLSGSLVCNLVFTSQNEDSQKIKEGKESNTHQVKFHRYLQGECVCKDTLRLPWGPVTWPWDQFHA